MYNGRGCRRACVKGAPPMTCRYHFVMEYYSTLGPACRDCPNNRTACFERQCVTADGIERGIMTINRKMPGPSIQVCQGDMVVVDFENRIPGAATAIHWHGILQRGSAFSDGVPQLTQCPIPEGTTFRYAYEADEIGTYFWHSHDGLQKMDGLTGSIIVRSLKDPSFQHYDWDLPSHVIVLQDWLHQYTAERLPGPRRFRRGQRPDALLINGRGRFINPVTNSSNGIPLSEFRVFPGFRYRFRLIHAGCLVCPLVFTVQKHYLTAIATDGSPNKPVVVDSLVILPGERYDVVINANRPVGIYWISLRAVGECENLNIYQEALLIYEGASYNSLLASPSPGPAGLPEGVVLNPLAGACKPGQPGVCVNQLQAEGPLLAVDPVLTSQDVIRMTMTFDFHTFDYDSLFKNPHFYKFYVPAPSDIQVAGRMNNISLILPPAPPLSQPDVLENLCASGSEKCCQNPQTEGIIPGHRECINIISVPTGSIVEILYLDNMNTNGGLTHPIHMHGLMFYVLEIGSSDDRLMGKHLLSYDYRNNPNPNKKDTIAVPSFGYAKIRFKATNPGYWLIHCHILFHLDSGMGAILKIGEQSEFPAVPKGFPRCGDYKPGY
ncbi:uncharacterized protein LOC132198398 isoform X2 [Neocloeon triangulifer]|nr:uncharacterized protein LOC132198398 isoform X2 [Neocloeon triangulifer]XP_059478423.1 uncharacterized protein LOC132198398 isoform X2 [Neocloeon triangulifer]XP_059478433.1 uncharacterized protein LOC132198398 isoform X2 [Neocloeon triangulifer]XP_059478442.1 uncharacterized protein LOC132198398 isoform X2 [Neocloeon triangulifer]